MFLSKIFYYGNFYNINIYDSDCLKKDYIADYRTFCTGQHDLAKVFWLIKHISQAGKLIASIMIRAIPSHCDK